MYLAALEVRGKQVQRTQWVPLSAPVVRGSARSRSRVHGTSPRRNPVNSTLFLHLYCNRAATGLNMGQKTSHAPRRRACEDCVGEVMQCRVRERSLP